MQLNCDYFQSYSHINISPHSTLKYQAMLMLLAHGGKGTPHTGTTTPWHIQTMPTLQTVDICCWIILSQIRLHLVSACVRWWIWRGRERESKGGRENYWGREGEEGEYRFSLTYLSRNITAFIPPLHPLFLFAVCWCLLSIRTLYICAWISIHCMTLSTLQFLF